MELVRLCDTVKEHVSGHWGVLLAPPLWLIEDFSGVASRSEKLCGPLALLCLAVGSILSSNGEAYAISDHGKCLNLSTGALFAVDFCLIASIFSFYIPTGM
ncbi:hypothetical protein Bca4012_006778 [Brassica carinata]